LDDLFTMPDLTGPDINVILGKNIKRLRSRKKFSQLILANMAGLTHNFINEIENGRKWISPESFAKLAKVLDADPQEFFISISIRDHIDTGVVSDYINDISDTVNDMVHELRVRYLGEDVDEGIHEPQKHGMQRKSRNPIGRRAQRNSEEDEE
jgi:transcriptional regulator with XRE-family HTH domain